jgi:hypothetical protein
MTKLAGIAVDSTDVLVSVSGPGITYSHVKNDKTKDIHMQSINQRTLNNYNDRDIVPWIDKQEGLTQLIACPDNYTLFQCHEVELMLCNVLQICGNPRGFTLNKKICER